VSAPRETVRPSSPASSAYAPRYNREKSKYTHYSLSSRNYQPIDEDKVEPPVTPRKKDDIVLGRSTYKSVLEAAADIQRKYQEMNTKTDRRMGSEYEHLRPSYKPPERLDWRWRSISPDQSESTRKSSHQAQTESNSRLRSLQRPLPAAAKPPIPSARMEPQPEQRHVHEESNATKDLSARYVERVREVTASPAARRPTYNHSVKDPSRYLAANLSTGIYTSSRQKANKESSSASTKGLTENYRNAESQPSLPARQELREDNVTIRQPNQAYVPREIRSAMASLDYVKNTNLKQMVGRQGYGKPFFNTPVVLGI